MKMLHHQKVIIKQQNQLQIKKMKNQTSFQPQKMILIASQKLNVILQLAPHLFLLKKVNVVLLNMSAMFQSQLMSRRLLLL